MRERVLVVEDEETLRRNLVRYLEQAGHTVRGFESAEEALVALDEGAFDVAVIDMRLPGRDGLSLASDLAQRSPDTLVLMMTAYGTIDSVIEAMHVGVHDYMVKPVPLAEVARKVNALCEHRKLLRENARLRQKLEGMGGSDHPIARSKVMRDLFAFVKQVAPSNSVVLIEGESGSGKEVVARAIHDASPRHKGPFLAANMAAIPSTLVENHLFGHERGAYTGADCAREGLFRAAAKGTLFLDEIGDMPLAEQAKLLRVLETREVTPVGGDRPIKVDCRVVAATNADLLDAVREKRFRSDLYYRLAAIRVRVPPLRERPEDIPALANAFLGRHVREHGRPITGFEGVAMQRLLAWPWPGNVRELSNVVEHATVVCTGTSISVADLPREIAGAAPIEDHPPAYQHAMNDFERSLIASMLEQTNGDRREAARLLGLSLATLYRRIEKLGLKGVERASAS